MKDHLEEAWAGAQHVKPNIESLTALKEVWLNSICFFGGRLSLEVSLEQDRFDKAGYLWINWLCVPGFAGWCGNHVDKWVPRLEGLKTMLEQWEMDCCAAT